jgi:sigma-B regulation protein RsbU (phosphoserine phosphatase)
VTPSPAVPDLRLRRAALVLLFRGAAGFQVRASRDVWRALREPEALSAVPLAAGANGVVVRVRAPAEQAGVHTGDHMESVDGQPYRGMATLHRAVARARPGDVVTIGVRRPDGTSLAAPVPLAAERPGGTTLLDRGYLLILGFLTPVLCLILGFWAASVRPQDHRAWILLFLLMSLPHRTLWGVSPEAWAGPLRVVGLAFHELMAPTWPVWMLLFGIYFPTRLPFDEKRPWAKWLLIVPAAAGGLCAALGAVAVSEGVAALSPAMPLLRRVETLGFPTGFADIGLFFSAIGWKTGSATSPDARRRLSLLMWGAMAGLTPTFLLILTGAALRRDAFTSFPPYVVLPAVAALSLFPITLAYTIVVQQALDVRVVVRQGVQYALASRGVRALQVLIIAAVVLAASTLAGDPAYTRPKRIQYVAWGFAAAFLVSQAARRLGGFVDRRFFREAYDAERVLTELSENVRTMVEAGPLLETVVTRVSETLHVPKMAAFIRGAEGEWRAAAVRGDVGPEGRLFPGTSPTVSRLASERQPLRVQLADPAGWTAGDGRPDRATLEALDAQLLLPLAVKDNLLGALCLGPKLSEEAYSPSDMRLLRVVAAQTAMALENSQLTAAIAREVAQRARMDREIEIAREVQEGLFPQEMPKVHGLEYAGYCRPARGVGGDYYDFVEAPGGGLGIAIGDVSGKGIPAALLMASLRAALRAQTFDGAPDLARLVARLNRLIYEASGANRYATFFYATFDPATRRLDYVNAGHNAPFLFRGAGGEAVRLEGGGPVVGLLPEAGYETQTIDLRPGDLLVAYTDGISEALNAAVEEWGEERLAEAVRSRGDGCEPQALMRTLMEGADAFAAGAPQHDDMTVVVARVVA